MESVDAGTISKGGKSVHVTFRRTVHGPVVRLREGARHQQAGGAVDAALELRPRDGRPALLPADDVRPRALGQGLHPRRVQDAADLQLVLRERQRVGVLSPPGCCPLRPKGVNPDLPVNGEGKYEWKGYLANRAHPQVINPSTGYIVNWNNKPAKDFPAADSRWNEQSLQRQKLLTDELGAPAQADAGQRPGRGQRGRDRGRAHRRAVADAEEDARPGKAPNAARPSRSSPCCRPGTTPAAAARDADRDGKIDDPGVPILDAAWKGLTDAGLCDRLGTALCKQLEGRNARFDQPPGGQYGGWHQYMWKDLRALLGQKVARRLPPALLRRRQREDLLEGAVGGARRGAQAPGRPAGRRSDRVARARGQGADHLRPAAADHHAVHEQADRHPPGDAVRPVAGR